MAKVIPETLSFFSQIQENNNKEWFDKNKKAWEAIKANHTIFMGELQNQILKFDEIVVKEPKSYVSRINRDFRFTADKSPYQNHIFSLIARHEDEKKSRFYLQISPGDTFVAAGLWSPDNEILKKVRQEIDYTSSSLNEIISQGSFKEYFGNITGESLVRVPQGYEATNPNIELLKLKQYIIKKKFTDEEVLSDAFINELVKAYTLSMPFLKFLDEAIEG